MEKNDIYTIVKDKRFQWITVILLLLIVVIWTSSIRLSNWDILNDQTTGGKIPSDLDAFYYLRIAETIVSHNGTLPMYDNMRYNPLNVTYTFEIMPKVTVLLYHVANYFGNYTVAEANAFLPVLAYAFGLIFFFFLVYFLSSSKLAAISSATLLAFIPVYLQRTIGGFSDHDSLGIMLFLLFLIVYTIGLRKLEKDEKKSKIFIWGLITAFFSAFATVGWGGVTTYIAFIIPLGFLILWLTNIRHKSEFATKSLIFYATWTFVTPLMGVFFGFGPLTFVRNYMLSTVGLIGPITLVFVIIDYIFLSYADKLKRISWYKESYRSLYLVVIMLILGFIFLPLMGISVTHTLSDFWEKIFHPWGLDRISLTVAENAQPYVNDIIGILTPIIFWMFFAGLLTVGYTSLGKIKHVTKKVFAYFFWTALVCAALFTRISPTSIMQGTNFISQATYIVTLILSIGYFLWLYFTQEEINVSPRNALTLSITLFIAMSLRASMRHLFAITPFICFMVGFFIFKTYDYLKNNKGEIIKPVFIILLILSLLGGFFSLYNFDKAIVAQAKVTGPSANYQWQYSMAWVRENTPERSIIAHWWDYGYWVEYMGQRPSVTDGGHGADWDHFIGRYLLTTPKVETAFSLMKTYNASYLLIDPSDMGKYSAFSIIGSDMGGQDRYSAIPVWAVDSRQTVETINETTVVYTGGGMFVDEDINLVLDGKKVFLPVQKAGIGGIIWKIKNSGNKTAAIERPMGVYFYNGQRYDIPIRFIYVNDRLIDTGQGYNATVRIIPSYDGSQGISSIGAAVYLSPKVSRGLFAQLYLLNNSLGNFNGFDLVHTEDDVVAKSLRQQGAPVEEFIFYQGFRGPIKIWKATIPNNAVENKEFLSYNKGYGSLDNLTFVK